MPVFDKPGSGPSGLDIVDVEDRVVGPGLSDGVDLVPGHKNKHKYSTDVKMKI